MRGRLLSLTAGSAAANMAADQAILESVESSPIPTLRLYGWIEPTLSLGYFQPYQTRDAHPPSGHAHCVRRSTGGGAILHDQELTYCLVMPMRASATHERQQLYRRAHAAIAAMLADFGIRAESHRVDARYAGDDTAFLCFQRRTDEDLILSGYKILGSAQRRSRHGVLQHGSFLLKASRYAPEIPGIYDLTSQRFDPCDLVEPIVGQFAERLQVDWELGEMTKQEIWRCDQIEAEKFGSTGWLHRR